MKKWLFALLLLFACSVSNAQIITTIAGSAGSLVGSGDGGPATDAVLSLPWGVAIDSAGNVYIASQGAKARVRKIDTEGIITTFAGGGIYTLTVTAEPATAVSLSPEGILFDHSGNVYIADAGNNLICKVNVVDTITDYSGNFTLGPGYSGDGGSATDAQLSWPAGIAMDSAGNMYIADEDNNRVRKVTASGIITTIAGNGTAGYFGDGGAATAAELHFPNDIAIDGAGNLYISDWFNYRVRKITASGIITTIAGNGVAIYSGDGGLATSAGLEPSGVVVDVLGNVYISDMNSRIRMVNKSSVITTVAGNGTPGYSGDGMAATAAELNIPEKITLDCGGNLYIADGENLRIREVIYDHAPSFINRHAQYLSLCKVAGTTAINDFLAAVDIDTLQVMQWRVLLYPVHGTVIANYSATTTGDTITPTGLSYTPFAGYIGSDTFKIIVTDCGHLSDTTTVYVRIDTAGPDAGVILGSDTVCVSKAAITLTDNVTGGIWHSSNTCVTVSAGAVVGVAGGIDTVSYIVTNGCGSDTTVHIIVIDSCFLDVVSPLASIYQNRVLSVYPNPSTGTFMANFVSPVDEQLLVSVMNMMGVKVKEFRMQSNNKQELLLYIPGGIYFLAVRSMSGMYVQKLIIEP